MQKYRASLFYSGVLMSLLVPLTTHAAAPQTPPKPPEEAPEIATPEKAQNQRSGVYQSPLTFTFRGGAFSYIDAIQSRTDRMIEGFELEWIPSFSIAPTTGVFLGLQSGVLFSHTGAVGAGFFGRDRGNNLGLNSNVYLIPLNVVIQYQISGSFMLALNGGTNLVHRTVSNQVLLNRPSDLNSGGSTEFVPNVGLTAGLALGPGFGINLRADYMPLPAAHDLYTTTLGITFALV